MGDESSSDEPFMMRSIESKYFADLCLSRRDDHLSSSLFSIGTSRTVQPWTDWYLNVLRHEEEECTRGENETIRFRRRWHFDGAAGDLCSTFPGVHRSAFRLANDDAQTQIRENVVIPCSLSLFFPHCMRPNLLDGLSLYFLFVQCFMCLCARGCLCLCMRFVPVCKLMDICVYSSFISFVDLFHRRFLVSHQCTRPVLVTRLLCSSSISSVCLCTRFPRFLLLLFGTRMYVCMASWKWKIHQYISILDWSDFWLHVRGEKANGDVENITNR